MSDLDELRRLSPGWGGYDEHAIRDETIDTAKEIVSVLARDPDCAPCANGSVDLYWHSGGLRVLVNVWFDNAEARITRS